MDIKNNKIEIFCRYIRRNGKIIYPRNGTMFHFFIDADKAVKPFDHDLIPVGDEEKN